MSAKLSLSGKRALVTGGSRGIGAAIVERLAADGAQVAFTYSASPDAAKALAEKVATSAGSAFAIKADSANVAELQAAVAEAAQRLGGIDIVVNNAGIMVNGGIDGYDLEDFDRVYAVNVRAPFVTIQAALPHMSNGGRVINIGSNVGHRIIMGGSSVYVLTKSAIAGLTRGLAHELGARGITINSVDPGPTRTDMARAAIEGAAEMIRSLLPVGRVGEPEEIAAMVAHLAGSEAGYVTGARLVIDGGMSV
jgi:3-oxoacyl-[acyl-carrier protein] reductase